MIKVKLLGNNVRTFFVEATDRIAEALEREGVDTSRQVISISGVVLRDRLSETFEEYGIQDESEVRISAVVKAESAAVKVCFLGSTVKTAIHDVDERLGDVLDANGIQKERVIVSMKGVPVRRDDYGLTLGELGIPDETEVRISAVVKAESALA